MRRRPRPSHGLHAARHQRAPPAPACAHPTAPKRVQLTPRHLAADRRGLEELQWRGDNIDAAIKEAVDLVRDLDGVLATLKDNARRTQVGTSCRRQGQVWADPGQAAALRRAGAFLQAPLLAAPPPCLLPQDILRVFERSLMFERKDGKVYAPEELSEASAALMAARHTEMRDVGKEIGKLLSASNRAVKVRGGAPRNRRARPAPCSVVRHVQHPSGCPGRAAACDTPAPTNPAPHCRARRSARPRRRGATMWST